MGREKRYLTEAEFNRATEGLTIKPDLFDASRRYMVGQERLENISKSSNLKVASIQRKVRQIWGIHISRYELPADWIKAVVVLPKHEMEAVQQRSEYLLSKMK